MYRTWLFAGLAITTAAATTSARADVPQWCGVDRDEFKFDNASDVKTALADDPLKAIPKLVSFTCFPRDDVRPRAQEIERARQAWSKKLGLAEADWADAAMWAASTASDRQDLSNLRNDYEKKHAWSQFDAVEQFAAIQNGFPNNGAGNGAAWYTYLTDALGPKLTETGRVSYIRKACLVGGGGAVEWAMCQPDIDRLDRKKIDAELRASKASPIYRMKIRLIVYGLDAELAAHAAEVKELVAKDPAYAKMFEIAKTTADEWRTIYTSQAALVDLALAMDDARELASRKAFDGCDDATWAAWRAAVATIPAKRFEGFSTDVGDSWTEPAMGVITGTPAGYLASTALFTCANRADRANTPPSAVVDTIGAVIGYAPGLRGPRGAIETAIAHAGLVLDDASEQIDFPNADRRRLFHGAATRGYYGKVAKVAVEKGRTRITYSPNIEKQEECAVPTKISRVSYYRADGSPAYETTCSKWHTVAIDRTPDPPLADTRSATGLKAGMIVYFTGGDTPDNGFVIAAWQKGSRAPSFIAGVPVK